MTLSDLFLKLRYLLYIAVYGRYSKRPYHCQFQITRRCNLRCRYCCVWRYEWDRELTLKEIELLAKNLRLSGLKSVVITGGEPLLREDIVDVVRLLKSERLIVRLQSNGLLLSPGLVELLCEAGLDDIYISLDTLNREKFKKMSGQNEKALFDNLINNLKDASMIAKRYGAGRFILTVLTAENCDEVEQLINFARQTGFLIGIYGVETSSDMSAAEIRVQNRQFKLTETERKKIAEAFSRVLELKSSGSLPIFNSVRLIKDYIEFFSSAKPDMRWNCHAGLYYLVVLPDGSLSVCNATEPLRGFDYRNLPELYNHANRNSLFEEYYSHCSGCICTRQLEYLLTDKVDLLKKTVQYLRAR